MSAPIPFVSRAFEYGASTAREEALLKAKNDQEQQTNMIKQHAGGKITVPQIHTGSSSDEELNKHIANMNKEYMDHNENSKYDKLAVSNIKGGRKRKVGRKTKKSKKNKRKSRRTKRTNK